MYGHPAWVDRVNPILSKNPLVRVYVNGDANSKNNIPIMIATTHLSLPVYGLLQLS